MSNTNSPAKDVHDIDAIPKLPRIAEVNQSLNEQSTTSSYIQYVL